MICLFSPYFFLFSIIIFSFFFYFILLVSLLLLLLLVQSPYKPLVPFDQWLNICFFRKTHNLPGVRESSGLN